jgi:solute:Na+ symporter, SSS family
MGFIIGIIAYMAVMLGIGVYASRKNKSAEDYLVAGRSFGVWFNASTILITFVGAVVFIGDSSLAYDIGIWNTEYSWGMITTAGGGTLCMLLLGRFFIPILWKLKYLSLGDFYYVRFGKVSGLVATSLILFTFIFWVATNVVIFGKVVHPLLGWDINTAIWIGILVLTIYTVLGGMYAVCYTDVVQVVIMLLGLAILVPITISMAGGLTEVLQSTPETMKSILPQEGGSYVPWLAAWMILGVGSIASPDMAQRSFTAKSAKIAQKSFYIAAAVYLIIEVAVLLAGFSGRVLVEKGILDGALFAEDIELFMPIMIKTLLPGPIAVLFLGAVIAAVMGASDSALMAMSAMFSKNIYNDIFKPDASDKELIKITRITIVIVAILAGFVATSYPRAVELSLYGFDLALACIFAPLVFGLYYKKANAFGAMGAMVVGFIFRTFGAAFTNGFTFDGLVYPGNWYYFTLLSPIISSVTLVTISLLTQKQNSPLPLKSADGTVISI